MRGSLLASLVMISACLAEVPRVEVVQGGDPPEKLLEQVASDLDDSSTQFGQPPFRSLAYEARREGTCLLFLASRTRIPSAHVDETASLALLVDARPDAPEGQPDLYTEAASGRAVVVRKTLRLRLKEGLRDMPEDADVSPWQEVPLGSEVGGLSLALSHKEGTKLAWKVANHRDAPVALVADADAAKAMDRGCLSLFAVGPDGKLLAPHEGKERLAAPTVKEVRAGGAWEGELDLAAVRDLPAEGVIRVALVYAPVATPERVAAYAEGTPWPRAWSGTLASNELVLRLVSR